MTPEHTPEQVFQRYQQTADPAELAKVFDQTAPQLLLLAAHVSPDAAAAEDLVQETFLVAMEKAEQWDADRPLLPWLGGILRHRAQDLARRLKLRRPAAQLSDVYAEAEGVGPLGEAEGTELLQRVQEALERLQSPFREALVLRIVHGLQPTEIAHALGRPPATVRGQLKRGLEALRGTLPVGLASALALLLLPGKGIAATRQAVLANAYDVAQAKAGSVAAAVADPVRAPHYGMWLAAAALTIASFVGGYYVFFDAPPIAPPSGVVAAAETVDGNGSQSDTDQVASDTTERQDVTVVSKTPATPTRANLRGRCISAVDAIPLARGIARLAFGRGRFMTSDPEFRNWPDPIEVPIGTDGRFAIEFEPKRLQRVYLEIVAPGFTESSQEWTSMQSGIDVDLGDIKLLPGCRVLTKVVDEQGNAVPNAWISFEHTSGGTAGATFGMWSSFDRQSDAAGIISAEVLPAPGRYSIRPTHGHDEYKVVGPAYIQIGNEVARDLEVIVKKVGPSESIRGRVVDEYDRPVAGLVVCVDPLMMDLGNTETAADGSFVLPFHYPRGTHKLHLPMVEQRYRMAEPEREFAMGAKDLTVRVKALTGFDVAVEVVDARSGRPVEWFGVAHEIDYWTEERVVTIPPDRFYRPVEPQQYEGGRTTIKVYPGQHQLQVWPKDPELATGYMIPFTVGDDGCAPIRVELNGYADARVRLRDETGKPLAGVEVRLTHSLACRDGFGSLWSAEEFAMGRGGGRSTGVALQTLTTDRDGRAVFRAPIGDERLGLQLKGKVVRFDRRKMGAVPKEGIDWEIELPALAIVRGTIGPDVFLDRTGPSAEIRLTHSMVRAEDSDLPYNCVTAWLRDADGNPGGRGVLLPDGKFEILGALPGDYDLVLEDNDIGKVVVARVQELRAGETREVVADASKFVPARLQARVLLDGAPWSAGKLKLVGEGKYNTVRIGLDSSGRSDTVIKPGRYLPCVSWGDRDQAATVYADKRIELGFGADANMQFAFEHRVLRIKVLGKDGGPAKEQMLFYKCVDFPEAQGWREAFKTDADGMHVFDPVQPGRIELRLKKDGPVFATVAAEARKVTELTVQLPR